MQQRHTFRNYLLFIIFLSGITYSQFHVVGYFPSWGGSVREIQYDKLTCINYSFILPSNGSGGITGVNESKVEDLVTRAHEAGVKVCIAVGGWNGGNDRNFESMAENESSRTAFVNNLLDFCDEFNLDGVDIDWEYPDPGSSGDNYSLLMKQLGEELHSRDKILSAAVISRGRTGEGVQDEVFGYVDYLNIMSYDHGGEHSTWDDAVRDLEYWLDRGLPVEKAVLGVPFYGRGGGDYIGYNELVERDPDAPNKNIVDDIFYNGIPLIKQKTQHAIDNGGGIMFWELSQDTHDSTSLLSALHEVVSTIPTDRKFFTMMNTQKGTFAVHVAGGRNRYGNMVTFSIPQEDNITLQLLDSRGRIIFDIISGIFSSGIHAVPFNRNNLGSGVCVLRLSGNTGVCHTSAISVR